MCGIAGLYDLNGGQTPVDTAQLRRRVQGMTDLLRHRGPDDAGLWNDGVAALGHRRLSIIDLSPLGRNPMTNEDETIWITFNGEIYNYRELRGDLLARGHVFRSQTDTEAIIHLYEEYGPGCIAQLNGMFALGLWDGRQKRLLLARDRFGVKPLYYTQVDGMLVFASEVKAFLALPGFQARPDPLGLAEHFAFQNTFGERTFFDGVKLLPAGHYLVAQDGRIETTCYWDLRFDPSPHVRLEDWAMGLRERFETAVQRQLMSDVPLGTFLSGGMDTGSISAVAARHIEDMHTFTCGFDVPQGAGDLEIYFDERAESERLAHYLGTLHHELELGHDAMIPSLPVVVWHLDEPRVGISYQVYYTAEMIRRHVTVVLSGVGGDELFAGYPWRYEPILDLEGDDFLQTYYRSSARLLGDDERRDLFSPEFGRVFGECGQGGYSTYNSFLKVMAGADEDSSLHRALYFDFKTFLNGLLLVDDKLSMAHSVETRVPFLDNDLVDYVARIPAEFKLRPGMSKVVIREAMRGLLPDETIFRRKQGFTPPDRTWYKRNNLAYIQSLILGERALARGYFRPEALTQILDDHLSDRRNHRFLIWSLMCFEWWNRLFVDRDPVPPRPQPSTVAVERSPGAGK